MSRIAWLVFFAIASSAEAAWVDVYRSEYNTTFSIDDATLEYPNGGGVLAYTRSRTAQGEERIDQILFNCSGAYSPVNQRPWPGWLRITNPAGHAFENALCQASLR